MTEQMRVRESPAVMGEGGEEERKRKMVVCSVGDGKINGHRGGGEVCALMLCNIPVQNKDIRLACRAVEAPTGEGGA